MASTLGRIDLGSLSGEVEFDVVTERDGSVRVRPTAIRLLLRKPNSSLANDPPVEVGRLVYIDQDEQNGDGQ